VSDAPARTPSRQAQVSNTTKQTTMLNQTERLLRDFYAPHNRALETLVGRTFAW